MPTLRLVPLDRIELTSDDYKSTVLPLNYGGIKLFNLLYTMLKIMSTTFRMSRKNFRS